MLSPLSRIQSSLGFSSAKTVSKPSIQKRSLSEDELSIRLRQIARDSGKEGTCKLPRQTIIANRLAGGWVHTLFQSFRKEELAAARSGHPIRIARPSTDTLARLITASENGGALIRTNAGTTVYPVAPRKVLKAEALLRRFEALRRQKPELRLLAPAARARLTAGVSAPLRVRAGRRHRQA